MQKNSQMHAALKRLAEHIVANEITKGGPFIKG